MHRNVFWIGFLLIVAICALWFSIKGGYSLRNYYLLNTSQKVEVTRWEIKEINEGSYALVAYFSFENEGKIVQGSSLYGNLYPNIYAAESALKRAQKEPYFLVWYNHLEPSTATLQRKFPYKSVVSAILLFALLIYFIALGRYVAARRGR